MLFLILMAVALFAALSYAITQSNRSGSSDISSETAKTILARFETNTSLLRASFLRLTLFNNVGLWDLNVSNDIAKKHDGSIANPMGSPADPSLYIFHPSGGNVSPFSFKDIAPQCTTCNNSYTDNGYQSFIWCRINQLMTTQKELAVVYWGVPKEVCQLINDKSGIADIYSITIQGGTGAEGYVQGTAPNDANMTNCFLGPMSSALNGKNFFCIKTPDRYAAIYALFER